MTTRTTREPLSWEPVRDGLKYCAPACGRGCTIMEYDAAVIAANELVAALGPAWETRVHENLGWHWSAQMKGEGDWIDRPGIYPVINHNNKVGTRYVPVLTGFHAIYNFGAGSILAEGKTAQDCLADLQQKTADAANALEETIAKMRAVTA